MKVDTYLAFDAAMCWITAKYESEGFVTESDYKDCLEKVGLFKDDEGVKLISLYTADIDAMGYIQHALEKELFCSLYGQYFEYLTTTDLNNAFKEAWNYLGNDEDGNDECRFSNEEIKEEKSMNTSSGRYPWGKDEKQYAAWNPEMLDGYDDMGYLKDIEKTINDWADAKAKDAYNRGFESGVEAASHYSAIVDEINRMTIDNIQIGDLIIFRDGTCDNCSNIIETIEDLKDLRARWCSDFRLYEVYRRGSDNHYICIYSM